MITTHAGVHTISGQVWLHAIANGFDGALRWAISEKPWVIAAQSNTWVGDYTADDAAGDKAFDSYVVSDAPPLLCLMPSNGPGAVSELL
eukprot:COSAG01_NODE_797_length_13523_cov_34.143027_4_plen_89_part_00